MIITRKLEFLFLSIIVSSISVLLYNYYKSSEFKHSEIPQSYKERILQKEQEVLMHMQKNFGFVFKVPLIVSDAKRVRR